MDSTQNGAQPSQPPITLSITPQGMTISILLAPGVALTQTLPEDIMNAIVKQWIETRRQVKQQLELVQHVKRTKKE